MLTNPLSQWLAYLAAVPSKDVHGVDLANDPPPDVQLIAEARFERRGGGKREQLARRGTPGSRQCT